MKKQFKKSLWLVFVLVLVFASGQAFGEKINLRPIKPQAKQTQNLSDEQQAILAVRTAKASVVSIVGNKKNLVSPDQTLYQNSVSGTGFIVSSNGLVVSNSHVVETPNINYFVQFADGSYAEAYVLGIDKFSDIALLKIDRQNLPAARLGNSDGLETGQSVFAIGNTLGKYQNTVTRGVVSGLGRSINLNDDINPKPRLQNLIQTDASISPGNSGGPLVNLSGEVVGMNTLVDRQGEALGFAVPINTIKDSIEQIQKYGKVSRPYLGLAFSTINKVVKEVRKLEVDQGAFVSAVAIESPAERAGLKPGDVILEINREKLTEVNELDKVVLKYPAGTQILVTFFRNGTRQDAPLILGEFK